MTNITKKAMDAVDRMDSLINPANKLLAIPSHSGTQLAAFADMATIRAALQDKAVEVAVAIDHLYNERRDDMTSHIFPPVKIGTKLFAAHPAPVVPDDHPLMIFAKECELGAYMEREVPLAARKAIAASQQNGWQ